jgi:hypothetical protein
MSISYLTSSDAPAGAPQHVLVVAHSTSVFADIASSPLLAQLVPGDRSLFAAAAELLSPSREAGACTEVCLHAVACACACEFARFVVC